jgi:hypothetical protein
MSALYSFAFGAAFANIGSIFVAVYKVSQLIPSPRHTAILHKHKLTLHNVPLDLQLPTHKQILSLRIPTNHLPKILITQTQHNVSLLPRRSLTPSYIPRLPKVNVPGFFSATSVLELEGKYCGPLLDGVGFLFFGGVQGGGDVIKGCGGREGIYGVVLAAAD